MPAIDKLLKYLNAPNVSDFLDEDCLKNLGEDVIIGYKIDEDSRADWLDSNRKAVAIIKHCESDEDDGRKDFPFPKAAKIIYPLLAPAVIQMASRLITHLVQNDLVCEVKALGLDPDGSLEEKASRVTQFMSYELLVESDTWLKDMHKLCHIVAGWGTGFKQIYNDPISKRICDELISPEDVIINHNLSSLEDARRITIRHKMTKNEIISLSRSGEFCKLEDEDFKTDDQVENEDSRETNPLFEVLCQFTYRDLDDDNYAEPYKVYVLKSSQKVLGIYPAFEMKDIEVNSKTGQILTIRPRIDIVDYHCIDDPEGKFYSLGLNYLLLHQNKALTSVVRQLLDSGTLANTQAGFITSAFKTQEKNLKFKMGQFQVLEINPNVQNPSSHIIPLPFKEPSQVLLALLQVLIQGGKETGFITDTLTGDVEGQNTPATTMLAMVEQGTRAFKPVVQKLYISNKKAFKMRFHLHAKYLDGQKYALFQKQQIQVTKDDFNEQMMDICPVADPTQSSEAHKYAKIKFMGDLMNTQAAGALNMQAMLLEMFKGMQIPNAQNLITQPQPQQPDPKMIAIQQKAQSDQMHAQIKQMELQLSAKALEIEQLKAQDKQMNTQIKVHESVAKQQKMTADAAKDVATTSIQHKQLGIQQYQAETDRERVHVMAQQKRDQASSKGTGSGS
jgi:hypothetical protein